MAIYGIGTDLIDKKRIEHVYKRFPKRFVERLLTNREKDQYQAHKTRSKHIQFLAKRFAVKEAFAKALGTGIGQTVSFNQIGVIYSDLGKPIFDFSEQLTIKMHQLGIGPAHLSITDEMDHALAFVVLEKLT